MVIILRKIFFIVTIAILTIGGLFLFSQNSKSYDDQTTHPGITDEIVDFYNLYFDDRLTNEEKELIVQGSIDEDTPPRWINHFYDPTNGDGWKSENLGNVSSGTLKLFSKIFFNVNTEIVSSKNWAHNEVLQLKYQDYGGNRTWENAIRRYVNGDKEYAYKTLGHILHLLEDKTVPDHTRNDTHAHEGDGLTKDGGSPYEDYSSGWNRWNLTIAQTLGKENKSPVILNSIDEYFDYLANYSNQYFFSEHTINSEKYGNPKILREDKNYGYGKDKNDQEFVLVKKYEAWNKDKKLYEKIYTLEDNDNLVLSSYFSRLSSEAVLNGAGVIKLFKEEVAKAEKDKNLIKDEPKISWWQKMRSPYYGFILPVYDSVISVSDTIGNIFSQPQQISPMAFVANIGQVAENLTQNTVDEQGQESRIGNQELGMESGIIGSKTGIETEGVSIESELVESESISANQELSNNDKIEIIHAPYQRPISGEIIHAPYQGNNSGSIGNSVSNESGVFMPTGQYQNIYIHSQPPDENNVDDQAPLDQLSDTVPIIVGNDAPDINTEQSQNDTEVAAPDVLEQNQESGITNQEEENPGPVEEESAPPTPTLPDIDFYLTDYNVRNFSFTLNWEDKNSVIKNWELQYKLAPNFDWQDLNFQNNVASPDEGSADFVALYDDLTYYFRLHGSSADTNSAQTDWQYLQADISSKPVVINEIAWMGTKADSSDEWIELANKTNQEIDLTGLVLKTTDGIIDVNLTGKIAPRGFYLLERTNDDPVVNILADQIYKGALTNRQYSNEPGQNLILIDAENNMVDSVWTLYVGDNDSKRTSERVNIWSSSIFKNNWQNYKGEGGEAQDADGNKILGTPRAANSAIGIYPLNSGVFEAPPQITKDTILLALRGKYIANGPIGINNSQVTIEPGAEFEFTSFSQLQFSDGAKLIAKGTENSKIIINGNEEYTKLYFSGAKGEIENVEINKGKISANNSIIKINKSVIKNAKYGLLMLQNNSEFDISNSEFSGDNGSNFAGNPYYGQAIFIQQSHGTIQNSEIKNNQNHGIYVDSLDSSNSPVDILNNIFTSNSTPIATNGFINLNLEDNTIGAGKGLAVYNPFVRDGEIATISNKIPYLLYDKAKDNYWYKVGDPKVEAGGVLKIEPGAVIQFGSDSFLKVYGRLEAIGTLDKPVVFMGQWDSASYDNMISDIKGVVSESSYVQFYDGSEAVLENIISRQKIIDQYKNISYQSFWLVRE